MFDYKEEFLALVDLYQIQDETTRLIKSQELEDAFADRLQAQMLATLSEAQRDEIIQQAEIGIEPEKIIETMYSMIDDVDIFVNNTFEQFKQEFKANI